MSHTNLRDLFSDIADAIRAKTGDTAEIVADNFADAIAEIEGGTWSGIPGFSTFFTGTITPAEDITSYHKIDFGHEMGYGEAARVVAMLFPADLSNYTMQPYEVVCDFATRTSNSYTGSSNGASVVVNANGSYSPKSTSISLPGPFWTDVRISFDNTKRLIAGTTYRWIVLIRDAT